MASSLTQVLHLIWWRSVTPRGSSSGASRAGQGTAILVGFCTELGQERSEPIEAVSKDLGPAHDTVARKPQHATNAIICYDPF